MFSGMAENMGICHWGQGDEFPKNLQWGTLIEIVPRFSNFKYSVKYSQGDCEDVHLQW